MKNIAKENGKSLGARGRSFVGTVIASRAQKTVTVQWYRWKFLPKYDRYVKLRSKIKAHNPENISATVGDIVLIQECRPISKTKKFLIKEKQGRDMSFLASQDQLREAEAVREAKTRGKAEEEGDGGDSSTKRKISEEATES
ncbi:30S ribosomal protein S17 [Candidatus Woesearchaeota archaeon]|nr:30S ribosomal protein S17 [Candidatus Woesearchaeota archaeon]